MQFSVKIAVLAACLMLSACAVNASDKPYLDLEELQNKLTEKQAKGVEADPPLRKDQIDICDHRCSKCNPGSQKKFDERIKATPSVYFCKTCDLKPRAKLMTIDGKSPPMLEFDAKYVPTVTGETKCYGPAPTLNKEHMGILGTTKGDVNTDVKKDQHIKVFYGVPKKWRKIIGPQLRS